MSFNLQFAKGKKEPLKLSKKKKVKSPSGTYKTSKKDFNYNWLRGNSTT